jgi:hypothetical protein
MLFTPVLLLIFNRLETTKRVFTAIRAQQPRSLYIAADGPRPEKGEAERIACQTVREWVLAQIDWECDVHTLFRDVNLGCGRAVAEAITWFFGEVEEGIILEDDCLPNASFFRFCEEMLERYRDNALVMHITGDNYQEDMGNYPYSYYFSVYSHIWGWATWRRTWEQFDYGMEFWKTVRKDKRAVRRLMFGVYTRSSRRYRAAQFDKMVFTNSEDVWDYRYLFSLWKEGGLTIIPSVNLVQNIGAGEAATHLKNMSAIKGRPAGEMPFPLAHPPAVAVNKKLDLHVEKRDYQYRSLKKTVKRLVQRYKDSGVRGVCRALAGIVGRLLRRR